MLDFELLTPPQAVLYTTMMEPITIINMKCEWWMYLYDHGFIQFAVIEPINWANVVTYHQSIELKSQRVEVQGHKIINPAIRAKYLMMTTTSETEALLLEPGWLPGQTRKLNEEKTKSFIRGLTAALRGIA